jgi:Ran GTPase-activating protein (RanGAP) involved in mRNA processing and transport
MNQLAGYLSASITDLELDNAGLTEAGVEKLASVLDQGVCRLTKLVLRHNLCGDRGCIAIAVGLKSPDSSIATLDLTKNKIGTEGAAALGDALRTNTTLTDLGVAKNPLGDAGCAAIADAVGANTESGLRRLDLSQCSFGDEGATALADALETDGGKQWGTQISALFLGRNAISDEGADVLADALEDSIYLKELYLGGCRIKDRGAKLLVECLKINASVINLNIGDNVRYAILRSPTDAFTCALPY